MNDKILEALGILQEECAEVIQIVSKCRRFGIDELHLKEGIKNRELLNEEIGDILAIVDYLIDQNVITMGELEQAKAKKVNKLKSWSTLFHSNRV